MTTSTASQTAETTNAPTRNPMAAIRRRFPSLRRTAPTAIARSGSEMTVFACLCGATHTCATRSRDRVKHVREWLDAHSGCAADIVAAGLSGTSLEVRAQYEKGRLFFVHSVVRGQ